MTAHPKSVLSLLTVLLLAELLPPVACADEEAAILLEPESAEVQSAQNEESLPAEADTLTPSAAGDHALPLADAVAAVAEEESASIVLLKARIPPGTYQRLSWSATELFEGVPVSTPVLVVNGRSPGPTLCLTAAVHGDELNGIEVVRRVMHNLDPAKLSGAVIGIPIVNLQGFRRGSRYLPDRRDLNRYFPGNPRAVPPRELPTRFSRKLSCTVVP